jgi:hypothetical protein
LYLTGVIATKQFAQRERIMEKNIVPGKYRHYKGNDYQVYGIASHSESLETMVVYRALYGKFDLWVRPLEMFYERVEVNGKEFLRFTLLEETLDGCDSSDIDSNGDDSGSDIRHL